jgi:UDP-3-O-[3-hydroxymyristoyl] glucosamine N-acyltransferase
VARLLQSVELSKAEVFRSTAPVIHPTARVLPGAQVFGGAEIGADSVVGSNSVIFGNVRILERVVIGAGSVVGGPGFGHTTGPEGESVRVPQLGGVLIEDDVEIGALCSIDAGTLTPTWLGRGVKLDAQVHVGHNARVGAFCRIAAQVGISGSVEFGEGVWVGGQAGFSERAVVGARARIAAKSGVIGDVPEGATYAGFPAVSKARWLRAMATLLGRRRD